MAALTNRTFRRVRVGSSAGVRMVETVVAEVGFMPPGDMPDIAEAGTERTEEVEDHRGFMAELGRPGCAEWEFRAAPVLGVRDRCMGAGADVTEATDILSASSAASTRMLGIGASSGEMVLTVSSNIVVGVSGKCLGLPSLSSGAKPDRLA
jgi:hypothetical protein